MTDTVTGAEIAAVCQRAVTKAARGRDGVPVDELELTRETFEDASEEFESGRLYDDDLDPSPAFR